MARLAELQEIAEEEREAELARQAAELAGLYWIWFASLCKSLTYFMITEIEIE